MKTYCFDLDETLCSNADQNYANAVPIFERIDKVNSLYDQGNQIIIFTARGAKTGIDWRIETEIQLKAWNVKHHLLRLDKPFADFYIDDKAINVSDFDWH